jgi:hypothetical protein
MSITIVLLAVWCPVISSAFGSLKKRLTGKQCAVDADVKQAVTPCPHTLDTDFFYVEIQATVPW